MVWKKHTVSSFRIGVCQILTGKITESQDAVVGLLTLSVGSLLSCLLSARLPLPPTCPDLHYNMALFLKIPYFLTFTV